MTTARPLGRRATLFSVLAIGTVLFGLVLAVRAGAGTSAATPRLTSRASVRHSRPGRPRGRLLGGAITINDAGPATPYPSTCVVSGLSGSISDVNVQIAGLSHTYPDDIDMLLVSPRGQNAIFMSDAGGQFDLVNCDLTIDDEAPDRASGRVADGVSGELSAGELRAWRSVPGSGACAERERGVVHVRRRLAERHLVAVRRGRRCGRRGQHHQLVADDRGGRPPPPPPHRRLRHRLRHLRRLRHRLHLPRRLRLRT